MTGRLRRVGLFQDRIEHPDDQGECGDTAERAGGAGASLVGGGTERSDQAPPDRQSRRLSVVRSGCWWAPACGSYRRHDVLLVPLAHVTLVDVRAAPCYSTRAAHPCGVGRPITTLTGHIVPGQAKEVTVFIVQRDS